LLIGCHAVNLYGYSRPTVDIDLLVRRSELERWKENFQRLGFEIFREGLTFIQFRGIEKDNFPPVDLMIVSDETFGKLKADAQRREYLEVEMHLTLQSI
jgi:hypothetical protein